MESELFPELAPPLPLNISEHLHRRLNPGGDLLAKLYQLSDDIIRYGLTEFVMGNCLEDGVPKTDNGAVINGGPASCNRGMMFALAVGDCWLSAEEMECLNEAATEVDAATTARHEEACTGEPEEESDWPTILTIYSNQALDRVPAFRDLTETWVWAIEPDQSRHEGFTFGAGLMLCVMLAARQINRAQEVDNQLRHLKKQFHKDLERFIHRHDS